MLRLLLTACFILPALGHAAGLGRLTVQSALGEPLRAEVEVTSVGPGEEESLAARLASPDAYRQAGVDYGSSLMSIRIVLERRDGKPVVRLSSTRPINEPYMNVLLELQWAQGRLVREYTFLLDPPGYRERPASAAAAPAPAAQEPPAVARVSPAPAQPEARPLVPQAPAAPRSYEIQRGDTLGKIARETKPEGVTFQQMLAALYRANRGVFINDNINLIRTGRILQIPDREAASAIPAREASQLVQKHMADFAEYRARLGAAVTAAPASAAPPGREAAGRIAAKPDPAAPKDQLKLSRADAKPASPAARAAREDDRASSDRALKEAQSRVTDLEKNVSDLQKLLAIKNQQLAQLEQKAGAAPSAKGPEAPKPAAEAPKPAAAAPAPAVAKVAAEAPKPAAEAPKPAAEAPKPAAEAPKPAAEAPKPAPKPTPVAAKPKPAPAPEPSLVDEFLENPMALAGLGGVVLLLVAYGVYAWRRKKAGQTRFQESVMGGEPVLAPQPQPSAQAAATAAAVSAAVAATQATAAGPDADEVDPIAEADVYLAYGRDAQAEEILTESLARHPDRVAVHVKLLEIFAQRHDARSFAATAKKVQELTHGAGPEWEKACALGHSIDPENPLYGAAASAPRTEVPAAAPSAAAPGVDIDLGGSTNPGASGSAATLDFDVGSATTPGGESQPFKPGDTVILQPGGESPAGEAAPQQKADELDFDLGDLSAPAAPAQPAAAPAAPAAPASLDFDFNLEETGAPKAGNQPAAAPPVDLSGISLDLGTPAAEGTGPGGSPDPRWQEVATKLDLAKAYQGMGDKDGARQLLNEVMSQGDPAQQAEARQLLSALG